MYKLANQAIEGQAKSIKSAMSMVGLCIMNDDFTEAVKFANSLSSMAFGTEYEVSVNKYIESVSFIYGK